MYVFFGGVIFHKSKWSANVPQQSWKLWIYRRSSKLHTHSITKQITSIHVCRDTFLHVWRLGLKTCLQWQQHAWKYRLTSAQCWHLVPKKRCMQTQQRHSVDLQWLKIQQEANLWVQRYLKAASCGRRLPWSKEQHCDTQLSWLQPDKVMCVKTRCCPPSMGNKVYHSHHRWWEKGGVVQGRREWASEKQRQTGSRDHTTQYLRSFLQAHTDKKPHFV